MFALKTYLQSIAPLLGASGDALYERQRALVRMGVLHAGAGRGPGSGVKATPESIGMLLLSFLGTEGPAGTAEKTAALAQLSPSDGDRCPLTGQRSLIDAIVSILRSESLGRKVEDLTVSRTIGRATISFRDRPRGKVKTSTFGQASEDEGFYFVKAGLSGAVLNSVALDLSRDSNSDSEDSNG